MTHRIFRPDLLFLKLIVLGVFREEVVQKCLPCVTYRQEACCGHKSIAIPSQDEQNDRDDDDKYSEKRNDNEDYPMDSLG